MRDRHIIKRMAGSSVGTSVAFREESYRSLFEPLTPDNEYRLNILKEFREDNIHTFILICPIIPYITDIEYLIAKSAPHARDIWFYRLILNTREDRSWNNFMKIMHKLNPEYLEKYGDIFFDTKHEFWEELRERLWNYQNSSKLNLKIFI